MNHIRKNNDEGEENHNYDFPNDINLKVRQPLLLQKTSSLSANNATTTATTVTVTHSSQNDDHNHINSSSNINHIVQLIPNDDIISRPSMQFHNLQQHITKSSSSLSSSSLEDESNYPNRSMNSEISMNGNQRIGQVSVEILQCLGLPLGNDPKSSLTGAASTTASSSSSSSGQALPFALIVCGSYAFQTDCGIACKPLHNSHSSTPTSSTTTTTTPSFKNHATQNNMNPMWTCDMRRACIIPINHAYARIYIGLFRHRRHRRSQQQQQQQQQLHIRGRSNPNHNMNKSPSTIHSTTSTNHQEKSHKNRDIFIGRVVIDIARLRPMSYYDVTLPLRQSSHVYVRPNTTTTSTSKNMNEHHPPAAAGGCGAIRFRIHLQYDSERRALLSYLLPIRPKRPLLQQPNDGMVVVHCCDVESFQNVSRVVHGVDMPNHFSIRQLQATIREINLTRIHVLRYLRKQECYNLYHWRHPTISAFIFIAYMHSIYYGTVKYIPGHVLTYLLLHLYKNYAYYGPLNTPMYNEFIPPTWEELFMALVRNGSNTHNIAPIEMEMKQEKKHTDGHHDYPIVAMDVDTMAMSQHTTMSSSSTSTSSSTSIGKIPIKLIAQAFEEGVNTQSLRHHFRVYHNVFRGNDAVTFLVHNGYATSRDQAVTIGRRLSEQIHLFKHVAHEHRFEDKPLFYVFTHNDRYEYAVKTHQPLGKNLFRMLGFLSSTTMSKTKMQLEMPYADGADHPRIKVKESFCIPFKSAKKALVDDAIENELRIDSDGSDSMSDGFENGMNSFLDQNSFMDDTNDDEADNDSDSNNVQYLKKPPNQNMAIKNKNEKPIHALMNEARNKVHGALLHLFDDRVYTLPKKGHAMAKRKVSPSRRNLIHAIKSQRHLESPRHRGSKNDDTTKQQQQLQQQQQEHEQCKTTVINEYDKLLGIGKYSHPNVVIARLGLYVQPIIEIAIGWLSLFRALFNMFTWQDPILSFWVSFIGPILIVVLHIFPWRLVLGLVGFVVFGPQNWILRILRERKNGPDIYDPDRIVHRNKFQPDEDDQHTHVPLFSSYLAHSGRVLYSEESEMELFSSGTIRQVIVPYSPLMYSHRFYDWPPESEHTRISMNRGKIADGYDVTTTTAPKNNENILNDPGVNRVEGETTTGSSLAHHSLDSLSTNFEGVDDHHIATDTMIHVKSNHLIHRRLRRIRPFHTNTTGSSNDGNSDNNNDDNNNNDITNNTPSRWTIKQLHEKLRHRSNNSEKAALHYSSSMEDNG